MNKQVFITGGSGYVGRRLISELLKRNYRVNALVRKGSEGKIPEGCSIVLGNPLDANSFSNKISPSEIFVQLVGVSHPSPSKAEQFRQVDLVSAKNSISLAKKAGVKHFIYISVAHPAPIMLAYQSVRKEAEQMVVESGMNASIIRPWYILGPGHRWPIILFPAYALLKHLPSTKETARKLDLLTLSQILKVLIFAIETPPNGIRIYEAPEIKKLKHISV